jgi:hypothetical protein
VLGGQAPPLDGHRSDRLGRLAGPKHLRSRRQDLPTRAAVSRPGGEGDAARPRRGGMVAPHAQLCERAARALSRSMNR